MLAGALGPEARRMLVDVLGPEAQPMLTNVLGLEARRMLACRETTWTLQSEILLSRRDTGY